MLQADDVELLLVEDSASDEELTVHALRRYNLTNKLHVVRDGEEALDFIFCRGDYAARKIDNGPKVVLLDIKLPKVDGLAVLRQIKEDERTKHIPVVLLTSSQEETDVIAGYEFGANSYIVKPVGFIELTEAVREIGMYWLILNKPPVEAS
jgi:DNA-binding response OmpR family regulator